jgi:hypothetical protein
LEHLKTKIVISSEKKNNNGFNFLRKSQSTISRNKMNQ